MREKGSIFESGADSIFASGAEKIEHNLSKNCEKNDHNLSKNSILPSIKTTQNSKTQNPNPKLKPKIQKTQNILGYPNPNPKILGSSTM